MALFRRKERGSPAGAPERLAEVVRRHMPEADEESRRIVTAVAGLLACVAYADREYAPKEARTVRSELTRVHGLSPGGIDAVCGALEEDIEDLAQVGDQAWTRELKDLGARELRVEVLDALVEIAAADHEITLEEANYLRRLATSLGLTQSDYDALQARHRDKLTFLS